LCTNIDVEVDDDENELNLHFHDLHIAELEIIRASK
jgi:hypothetical protein